jgi:hypothetical protein
MEHYFISRNLKGYSLSHWPHQQGGSGIVGRDHSREEDKTKKINYQFLKRRVESGSCLPEAPADPSERD